MKTHYIRKQPLRGLTVLIAAIIVNVALASCTPAPVFAPAHEASELPTQSESYPDEPSQPEPNPENPYLIGSYPDDNRDHVHFNLHNQNIDNEKLRELVESGEIPANVTELDLSDNRIRDITPLGSLTDLRTLFLMNNRIQDISTLKELPDLESVVLDGNPLSSDEIEELMRIVYSRYTMQPIYDPWALSFIDALPHDSDLDFTLAKAYMTVFMDMTNHRNGGLKYIALDTSFMLLDPPDTYVWLMNNYCDAFGLTLLLDDYDGLKKKKFIKDMNFHDGYIVTFQDEKLTDDELVSEVSFWSTSLAAVGVLYTAKKKDDSWLLDYPQMMWIS